MAHQDSMVDFHSSKTLSNQIKEQNKAIYNEKMK